MATKKSGLNRAILDQGWGEFRRQLGYKMAWNGGILLCVASHHTSQTCPCCGQVAKENRLKEAEFLCVACGHAENADVVGAVNMLERGQRLLACAEEGSGRGRKTTTKPASVKQEPTEVTKHEVSHAQSLQCVLASLRLVSPWSYDPGQSLPLHRPTSAARALTY